MSRLSTVGPLATERDGETLHPGAGGAGTAKIDAEGGDSMLFLAVVIIATGVIGGVLLVGALVSMIRSY
ncbi:MAG TPA: hypothetical protein VN759_04080 [Pseudolysinimonas sp.]|nr:hypothetical protein [Pseudolysinimonas sp.]